MNIFQKIYASVDSRLIKPYKMKHFSKTGNGRKLLKLKNRYKGKRCFFIGNGPSLNATDLSRLYSAGEFTFAFNRIYEIFEQTPWRPTFYISQDEKMLGGCADRVNSLDLKTKFIPVQLNWWYGINIDHALYFNMISQISENPREFGFSDDISSRLYNSNTVMYTAAQLAAYMGFAEIYLIGVDHHFRISQNNKGELIVDKTVKDYFSDSYNQDKDKLYIPNIEKSTLTYIAMEANCKKRNIKVFNATRGGELEIFPRVDFDSLFN